MFYYTNEIFRAVARSMTELRTFRLDCYTMPANVSALFPNSPHMRIYSLLLKQVKCLTVEYVA